MKNRTRIIAIITILLCIIIYPTMKSSKAGINAGEIQRQEMDMNQVFQTTGSTWIKTHVNAWAIVGELSLSMEELEDIGLEIVRFLEINDDYELLKNHHNNIKQVSIKGLDENKINYDIIVTNTRDNSHKGIKHTYETHVIVNALMDNDPTINNDISPQELWNKIEGYFETIEKAPQISTTYTGKFKGELTKKQKKGIIDNLISEIKGETTQTMEDDDIVSVAGYSPVIHTDPIENINFHIALRYSEYTDSTYIWMGSPIITIEY